MLALLYMLDGDARGAKSLILSSTLSSASLWAKELHRMIKFMDERDQEAIKQAESTGDFTSPEYLAANERFMELHSCAKITSDAPEPLRRKKIGGKRAYLEAWGPNEYNPQGNLHSYEVTDRLNEISVPTLITSGTDDLARRWSPKRCTIASKMRAGSFLQAVATCRSCKKTKNTLNFCASGLTKTISMQRGCF